MDLCFLFSLASAKPSWRTPADSTESWKILSWKGPSGIVDPTPGPAQITLWGKSQNLSLISNLNLSVVPHQRV